MNLMQLGLLMATKAQFAPAIEEMFRLWTEYYVK